MQKTNPTPIPGVYQASPRGFGFVIPADGSPDWFIPRGHSLGAWDGDSVAVLPVDPARREGRVTAVTRRANPVVTGTLHRAGRAYLLTPDRDRLTHSILLTGRGKALSPGLRAAVAVVSYGTATAPAMGTLREVFGPGNTRESAQAAILYHYDVHPDFPPEVDRDALALPQTVSESDCLGRRDFRGGITVTIDSQSAKDLDDAVSLSRDSQGRRVLGVHIADVSHYVAPKTPIDLEAYHRATSVYYVNQVAPMLPVALSNGICSLNPRTDRLTLSCLMTLDDRGEVVDYELCHGVIRTADRLNYDEVNTLLSGTVPDCGPLAQSPALRELVAGLDALARQRMRLRRRRGALELTSTECQFRLDETGRPVAVERRETGRGERLIEECMLLANETVARHLCRHHIPGLFRVHETPSSDKTAGLQRMVAPLGYNLKEGDSFHLQALLDHFQDTPMAGAVNLMVLRSLMKARYDAKNLGHFGLGAEFYCHFTSPIRRYPDLLVHRAIAATLAGASTQSLANLMPAAAKQCSEREVAAQNAEREIEKLYLAEFMVDKVGQTFSGTITGVTKFGVFVGLESGVEGLVPLEALPDDRYDLDESSITLKGRRTGTTFSLGAPMEVVCAAADPSSGKVDFVLPDSGIPSGIIVQTNHRLDTRRRRAPCSKRGSSGFSPKPKRRRGRS